MRKGLLCSLLALAGCMVVADGFAADYVTTTVNADDATKQDVVYTFNNRTDAQPLEVDLTEDLGAVVYNTSGEPAYEVYRLATDGLSRIALDSNVSTDNSSAPSSGWWWREDRVKNDGYDYQDGLQLYSGSGAIAILDLEAGDKVVIYGVALSQSGSYMKLKFPGATSINGEEQTPYKEDGEADYSVTYSGTSTSNKTYETITIEVESAGYVAAYGSGNKSGYIHTITITEDMDSEIVSYTVNYVDDAGTQLKESETREAIAGTDYTLSDDDKASLTIDGVLYVYDSFSTTSETIEAGAVLNIIFREAQKYTYTIYATVDGEVKEVVATGEEYEGETIAYGFPMNINVDGTLYKCSSSIYYGTLTISSEGNDVEVAYSATSTTDVLYLIEGENIDGFTAIEAISGWSNYAAGYCETEDATELVDLQPGTYTIYCRFYQKSSTAYVFYANEEVVWSKSGVSGTYNSGEFTLASAATISVTTPTSGDYGIDYMYIAGTPSDDLTNGIGTIASKSASDAQYYNLQGLKVESPTRGLYIRDGKKIIVK